MSPPSPPLPPELDASLERLAWALARNLAERYRKTGSVVPAPGEGERPSERAPRERAA